MWGSAAADRPGSRNLAGIKSPVVDELIETIVAAPDREHLIPAVRALDRVLLWGFHVVPQFHAAKDRIAYWDKFGRPAKDPAFSVDIQSWWIDPAKEAALQTREKAVKQ